MNSYVKKLHNALCNMCIENCYEGCEFCDFQRPINIGEYNSFIINEEEIGPDKICSETIDGLIFYRVNDVFVAVADENTFIKLANAPYSDVKDFFLKYLNDASVTKAVWEAELASHELEEFGCIGGDDGGETT